MRTKHHVGLTFSHGAAFPCFKRGTKDWLANCLNPQKREFMIVNENGVTRRVQTTRPFCYSLPNGCKRFETIVPLLCRPCRTTMDRMMGRPTGGFESALVSSQKGMTSSESARWLTTFNNRTRLAAEIMLRLYFVATVHSTTPL
jgi:hypothetical protein